MIKAALTAVALKKFVDYLGTFNNLEAPGGNLGIPRHQMPQIEGKNLGDFVQWLKKKGIASKEKTVQASTLSIVQNEFNKQKVMKLMKDGIGSGSILVSSDNYVLDGTHRFLAEYNKGHNRMIKIIQINKPIRELLNTAKEYSKAVFRHVNGEIKS